MLQDSGVSELIKQIMAQFCEQLFLKSNTDLGPSCHPTLLVIVTKIETQKLELTSVIDWDRFSSRPPREMIHEEVQKDVAPIMVAHTTLK